MSHEAIIFGIIEGASYKSDTEESYRLLQNRNVEVINSLPEEDEYPWLTKAMFAFPGQRPQGTFREQVIHFGLSLKDDPNDRERILLWIKKFESLLKKLYWWQAQVMLSTDFEEQRVFYFVPTDDAVSGMMCDNPKPVSNWTKDIINIKI
jgi:hypothetical protein